jgi:PhoPQ-activated pathogenicity-related protein
MADNGLTTPVKQADFETPLWDYLRGSWPESGWVEQGGWDRGAYRRTDLRLKSQTWHGIPWEHRLTLIDASVGPAGCPGDDIAILYIAASDDGGDAAEELAGLASITGAIVAVVYDVPNQPLLDGLYEDALIARSFNLHLDTGDDTWPLLFPMVRSAAAAMSAVQEWASDALSRNIRRFVVTGASKRGWTSWLTGALDPRVAGIAPVVYNNLNLGIQARRQFEAWGALSGDLGDYVRAGVMERLQTPEGQRLAQMVDPYCVRGSIFMPKLLIHATNDSYWPVDAASVYIDDVLGDTRQINIPNSPHRVSDTGRLRAAQAALFRAVALDQRLPGLSADWLVRGSSCLVDIRADGPMASVTAWVARAAGTDFRASEWQPSPVAAGPDDCRFILNIPTDERVALFIEAEFEMPGLPGHSGPAGEPRLYRLSSTPVILPGG